MLRYIWQETICFKRMKLMSVQILNFLFYDGKISSLCTESAADSIDSGRGQGVPIGQYLAQIGQYFQLVNIWLKLVNIWLELINISN